MLKAIQQKARPCAAAAAFVLLVCAVLSLGACADESGSTGLLATTQRAQEAARASESSSAVIDEAPESSSEDAASEATGIVDEAETVGESADQQPAESAQPEQLTQPVQSTQPAQSPKKPSAQSKPESSKNSSSSSSSAPSTEDKQSKSDKIAVSVAIDSANAAKANAKYPRSLGAFNINLESGATAYDALIATSVTFTTKDGNYIDSIGGISEKACGASSGWMFSVNGKFPGKSAMKFTLSEGDRVRFVYTVTMGDV